MVPQSEFDLLLILPLHDVNEVQFLNSAVELELRVHVQELLSRVRHVDLLQGLDQRGERDLVAALGRKEIVGLEHGLEI